MPWALKKCQCSGGFSGGLFCCGRGCVCRCCHVDGGFGCFCITPLLLPYSYWSLEEEEGKCVDGSSLPYVFVSFLAGFSDGVFSTTESLEYSRNDA